MRTANTEIINAMNAPQLLTEKAASLDCSIRPFILQDGQRAEGGELTAAAAGGQRISSSGAPWLWHADVSSRDDGSFEIMVTFKLLEGNDVEAIVGLSFEFGSWQETNYVFMPAAVYQGNDFAVNPMPYPPIWRDEADFRVDMPVTITDMPRLNRESPKLVCNTGELATPCMAYYSPTQQRGALVFTEQQTRLGNSGLSVELGEGGGTARFSVTAPCLRELRQGLCERLPSEDLPASWKAGDELKLRVLVRFFTADRLQGLFDHFCELRKALHPQSAAHCLPFTAALRIIEEKYNRENWVEDDGYYKMAPNYDTTFEVAEEPLCFLWQLGWVGGGQATLPLLFDGGEVSRNRVLKNLGMIFDRTQVASGFFLGLGDGRNFFSDGFDRPWPHEMHMVRKSADWLYFSIKQFDLMEKTGAEVPPAWNEAVRRLADAFVTLWETYGQFGQFINVQTGAILVGGSCAGGIAPAGLAMAASWFEEPRYLEVAQSAGKHYYETYVLHGITNGGPGEILSCPDSEAAFALIESFVKLFETDGDSYWLTAARDTVRQAATWVVSYDYEFPETSDLAKCGAHSTGSVCANIQNKHSAPSICTLSGESLFRLWRVTKDPLALELLHDIAHGIPQYLSREDRPLSDRMQPGWMCERVNMSDWEGAGNVGGNLYGSCWPEVSMMLTAIEIPGLYVQPDTGFVHVFDHVVCSDVIHQDGSVRLKLTNPTDFDADLKVMSESSSNCLIPLGLNPLYSTRRILVPAGASVEVEFHS